MTIPPAHRRLVPRRPKEDPEDFEITSKHVVIHVDQTPDPALAETDDPDAETATEEDSDPPADDSLSMTAIRPKLAEGTEPPDASDFFNAMTAERISRLEPERPAGPTPDPERSEAYPDALAIGSSPPQRAAPDPGDYAELDPTSLRVPKTDGRELRPTSHISPAERGLLAAMAEGHEPSRLKYMEWLERRGEGARAEFLMLDHALATMPPDDPRRPPTFLRLRELAERISIDWRSRVARSRIEGCGASQCPGYWRALPNESDDMRPCGVCFDDVYYCATVELARARIHNGQRVAIDITCERWPGDVEPRCPSCQSVLAARTRFCTQCGQPL
jgi:hypothetical protein